MDGLSPPRARGSAVWGALTPARCPGRSITLAGLIPVGELQALAIPAGGSGHPYPPSTEKPPPGQCHSLPRGCCAWARLVSKAVESQPRKHTTSWPDGLGPLEPWPVRAIVQDGRFWNLGWSPWRPSPTCRPQPDIISPPDLFLYESHLSQAVKWGGFFPSPILPHNTEAKGTPLFY